MLYGWMTMSAINGDEARSIAPADAGLFNALRCGC